tara:strand:- start:127 stop:984 length:858 start_codon:yes stop_codon:yes gene_type:complete
MKRAQQMALAKFAAVGDVAKLRDGIADIVDKGDKTKRGTWAYFANKFGAWIDAGMPEDTPFSVWSLEGNVKLPFAVFSTAPVVTCPGAGACAKWCYSFKGWRYPAAYLRQVQNTLLLTKSAGRRIVAKKTNELPVDIDCRLYVDGDFATLAQVAFWMSLINKRQDLRVYGYSKSWRQLLAYDKIGGVWPENYCLNLSNGGNAEDLRGDVARLPIVRGNFLTVDIDKRLAGKYDSKEYKTAVRQAAANAGIQRPLVCPGKCGECTPKGHFCGRKETSGVDVVIGVH